MELVWEPTVLYTTIPGYWADVQWEGENDWLWRVHTEGNVLIDWGHKETFEAAQQAVKEVLEGPKGASE